MPRTIQNLEPQENNQSLVLHIILHEIAHLKNGIIDNFPIFDADVVLSGEHSLAVVGSVGEDYAVSFCGVGGGCDGDYADYL